MSETEHEDLVIERAQEIAVRTPTAMVAQGEITVDDLLAQAEKVTQAMTQAMKEDVHYGKIPGVSKPSLLKPGAEKLCVLFRLAPHYKRELVWGPDDHLTAVVTCELWHAPTGMIVSTGEAICSTRETRYAWRQGERLCPECGLPQVRLGKPRDGRPGNWYCWKKQGGCGATWEIESEQGSIFKAMETGRVANPDLPDTWNTVLKMADKRALVAAVLNGTGASDVFTQDMEDTFAGGSEAAPAERAFDPETDLLPRAIKGAGAAKAIFEALGALAAHVDWAATAKLLSADVYGAADPKQIPAERKPDWLRRLSNATAKLAELAPASSFPPATDAQVIEAFAFAFSGHLLQIVAKDAPSAATPDVQPESEPTDEDREAALDAEAAEAASLDASQIPFGED